MATVKRTISLPPAVAQRLDDEASRRGMTFSALITERVSSDRVDLPYSALIDDDDDLSLRVKDILGRLAG